MPAAKLSNDVLHRSCVEILRRDSCSRQKSEHTVDYVIVPWLTFWRASLLARSIRASLCGLPTVLHRYDASEGNGAMHDTYYKKNVTSVCRNFCLGNSACIWINVDGVMARLTRRRLQLSSDQSVLSGTVRGIAWLATTVELNGPSIHDKALLGSCQLCFMMLASYL